MACFILTSRKIWVKLYFLKVESIMGGGISQKTFFFSSLFGANVKYSPFFLFCRAENPLFCLRFSCKAVVWVVLLRTASPFFFLKLARKESSLSSYEFDGNPTVTHLVELISYQLNGDDFFCSLKNKFL